MKKNLLIWGLALVLLIGAYFTTKNYNTSNVNLSSAKNPAAPADSALSLKSTALTDTGSLEKAIDFTLTDLNGKKVSLSDFRGKKVYLNFWASWCPPCRLEMPDIQEVYEKYKDKDLVVLAVNLGEDKNTIKSFIDKNKYSFSVLMDSDQSVALAYNITSIPVSYFIDKEGNVAAKRVGAMSLDQMESYINLLGK